MCRQSTIDHSFVGCIPIKHFSHLHDVSIGFFIVVFAVAGYVKDIICTASESKTYVVRAIS